MRKVLFIFGDFSDGDIEWLAVTGQRKSFPKGSILIQEGKPIGEVYILLDGQLSVLVQARRNERIATLQTGEIVGELSFLDSRPPSATVAAETDSIVLAISCDKLRVKLERDTAFAAKFYRALGVFLSDRLRNTMQGLGFGHSLRVEDQAADEIDPELLDSVSIAAKRFELLVKRFKTAAASD